MYNFNSLSNGYTPWYSQPAQQPQQTGSAINWVQGEAGAKSFAVAPGQSVLLMDSETNVFYIKSADTSGMPQALRIFDYKERVPKTETVSTENYITREEFEKRLAELSDAKQSV